MLANMALGHATLSGSLRLQNVFSSLCILISSILIGTIGGLAIWQFWQMPDGLDHFFIGWAGAYGRQPMGLLSFLHFLWFLLNFSVIIIIINY